MRRTPESEEASSYGYGDLLKEIIGRTISETTAGFKKPRDFSDEEIMEMAFAGVGGGIRGFGKILKSPIFKNTEEALAFGRSAPKNMAPVLKRAMREQEVLTQGARARYEKTKNFEELDEAIKFATQRQFYREALEVMTGEMQ